MHPRICLWWTARFLTTRILPWSIASLLAACVAPDVSAWTRFLIMALGILASLLCNFADFLADGD